ncbi:hypothetical protein [Streptomyces sp. NPDC051576]|uniref:hypothetical protein n=1 Tax=Streptomyces sp. NPDC051576 TaxID=3155803 RepID=UPI00341B576C
MTDREYVVGESIAVPWGLDTVEGTVVGAYGEGSGRRVLVEVNVGDGATETLPFPLRALEVTRSAEEHGPPGTWVTSARFEESVRDALADSLRKIAPEWNGETHSQLLIDPDARVDLAFFLPDRFLFAEVKHYTVDRSRKSVENTTAIEQLREYMVRLRDRGYGNSVGLLIMDRTPGGRLVKRAYEMRAKGFPVWVVEWEPDNAKAEVELRQVLAEATSYELTGA